MKQWMSPKSYPWPKIGFITVAYFLAAKIGMLLAIPPGYVSPIWPASGIALASVLIIGYRIWPAIWLGSFLANVSVVNVTVNTFSIIIGASIIGAGAVIQAIVGAFLLRKLTSRTNFFKNVYAVFVFIIFSAVLACLINSTIGTTTLLLVGIIPSRTFWNTWLTWWLGDLTGVITMTSVIMAWYNNFQIHFNLRKFVEGLVLLGLMIALSYMVFFLGYPFRFLIILFAIWASCSFGVRFATTTGIVLSTLVVASILVGNNSIFGASVYQSLLLSQLFIATFFITIMVLIAVLYERESAHHKIAEMNTNLQNLVEERTNQLEESLSLIKGTLESTADGILVVNRQGKVVDYNQQFLKMWNISPPLMDSHDDKKLLNYVRDQLKDPEDFFAKVTELYSNPEATSVDEIKFIDGRVFERYSRPQRIGKKIVGRVWSFRDVTRRKIMENQLLHQATHDTLTNLPNRGLLVDRIQQAILAAKRNNTYIAVLFFDLDNFKLINDNMSHNVGDALLLEVVNRLKQYIREKDTIARIGGDEFVVLLTDLHNESAIDLLVSKLLNNFRDPFYSHGHELHLSTSIGISFYPKDGETAESLLKSADSAMYKAKELGGNNFQFFTSALSEENAQRLVLENSLYQAYLHNEFVLHYQPLISFRTKKIVGAEVLLRWKHPTIGLIAPPKFIKLAEATGLIIPIGEWILHTACTQNKDWRAQGLTVPLAVNLSIQQFNHPNLVLMIENILKATDMDPYNLQLELTENALVENNQRILTSLQSLKQRGIMITLDDFGTGYSELDSLSKFPVSKIKINRTFISGIDTNPNNVVIIKAIITMAKSLNVIVTAEGVETKAELDLMKKFGCDEVQGYFLCRPLPPEEFEKLLEKNPKFFD